MLLSTRRMRHAIHVHGTRVNKTTISFTSETSDAVGTSNYSVCDGHVFITQYHMARMLGFAGCTTYNGKRADSSALICSQTRTPSDAPEATVARKHSTLLKYNCVIPTSMGIQSYTLRTGAWATSLYPACISSSNSQGQTASTHCTLHETTLCHRSASPKGPANKSGMRDACEMPSLYTDDTDIHLDESVTPNTAGISPRASEG